MLAADLLVRGGQDQQSSPVLDRETNEPIETHTPFNVYAEMLLQICRDYPGLPDPRTLELHEIRFFYDGLRADLKAATKPK